MTKIFYSDEKIQQDKSILGGKGFHLVEMKSLDLNVPDFCIIPTTLFKEYSENKEMCIKNIKEKIIPDILKKMNNGLFSIRSGAPVSMPGMMDTILNFGINIDNAKSFAKKNGDEFAIDCLKRFLMMYGEIALGFNKEEFDGLVDKKFKTLKDVVSFFEPIYKKHNKELPNNNEEEQLFNCIMGILNSWNNERAIIYRELHKIPHDMGTAIVIQKMVFGNKNENSATGVLFSRNTNTGSAKPLGEFLIKAQGEDVVAGVVTPNDFEDLKSWNEDVYFELRKVAKKLEDYFKDVQDIEFTIEDGKLYLLQTRNAKRTPYAALKFAIDMYKDEKITAKEVFDRVGLKEYLELNVKQIDDNFKEAPDAIGLSASNGITVGRVVFDYDGSFGYVGENKILLTKETTPDDMPTLKNVQGIITMIGGVTSHAAVVARSLNKTCIVGCNGIELIGERKAKIGGKEIKEGDWLTMDSAGGRVWVSDQVPIIDMEANPTMLKFEDLVFEAFSLIRVTSSINDLIKGNQTIFASYSFDDLYGQDLDNALLDIGDFLTGTLDLTSKIDYMMETGVHVHPFASEMAKKIMKNKIEGLLLSEMGDKKDFDVYLGKYYDEYADALKEKGYNVSSKASLHFTFLDNKEGGVLNIIKDMKDAHKKGAAISSKNALLGILK